MSISSIGTGKIPNEVNAVIEIPSRSSIKYEVCKDSGVVMVDRVMRSAVYYPANYGFVPGTLAADGDPVDILVLNDYAFQAGSVVKVRLIGVLLMEDEGGEDEKLLSVAIDKIDPDYTDVKSYEDLPQSMLDRIKNFFGTYKLLEPEKWVKVGDFKDAKEAQRLLEAAMQRCEDDEKCRIRKERTTLVGAITRLNPEGMVGHD